uniref:Major facilitator superfamily (MFS) profile domain-containing protein n=1 Tax=Mucochytrium quahogii TaxID=96639 RepID=A0A7S2RKJ3_9STRA|mmetsp:Transcript_36632/g.59074  ORF Transcript_36632/g.59074 Transcript_36632/m.59074 type:complete len:463 (+) Transcript_36632:2103-3491(+)
MTMKTLDQAMCPAEDGRIDFSDPDRVPPNRNHGIVLASSAIKMVAMTIIFTTSKEYSILLGMDAGFFPGLIIGVVPVVGGLSCFFWQYVLHYLGYKRTNLLMCCCGLIGSVMYSVAGHLVSPGLALSGRMLMGMAGASNIIFNYLALTTGKNKKTWRMTHFAACINFGLAMGPMLSGIVDVIYLSIVHEDGPVIFNTLSLPGWTMAFLYLLLGIGFAFIFVDIPLAEQHRFAKLMKHTDIEAPSSNKRCPEVPVLFTIGLAVLLYTTITIGICVGGTETRTAFVATGNSTEAFASSGIAWSWRITTAGFYLGTAFASFSFIVVLSAQFTKRVHRFEDRHWVIIFYSAAVVFATFLYNFHLSQRASVVLWTVGLITFDSSVTLAKIHLFSMALKIVPNRWLATYSSLLGAMNSTGRGVGPIIATYVGDGYLDANVFAAILMCIVATNTIAFAIFFPQFKLKSA